MPAEPAPLVLEAPGAARAENSMGLEAATHEARKAPKGRSPRCNSFVGLAQEIVGLISGRLRCAYAEK
jgi:hypothetical protein